MFAKKTLGQNFLKSKAAIRAMVEAAGISGDSTTASNEVHTESIVLEIGPGKGVLTEALLTAGAKVVAVEKDDRLIGVLQEKFKKELANGQLKLVHGDALLFDPSTLEISYKIVANIPYYITGQFFKHYLTAGDQPQSLVVMVQKEVAHRIVARDGKESLLSLSVKCYGLPRLVMTVEKKYFAPVPKVDSAIIAVENISRKFFKNGTSVGIDLSSPISEERFFTLIKAGFAHKRKVLIGNLEATAPREKLQTIFAELNISEKIRAEDLKLEDWKKIAQKIF